MLHILHIFVRCNCPRKNRPNRMIKMKEKKGWGINKVYNDS